MDRNPPADAELVAETLKGNREAFGLLYDRHARIVGTVVAGVSGDWSSADDMIQECFLRAYRNLTKLRDPNRFAPWIVGIARHVARERRRSMRRNRHKFVDSQAPELETLTDGKANTHDREQLDLMMQRVTQLPEKERLAIHAFYLQEQDSGQSADLLGLSRSGFYALVQRAIARLALKVRPCEADEEAK